MDLLKNNNRFSFNYGEKHAFERAFSKTTQVKGNEVITVYTFEHGLRITNAARKYEDFDAYEWVNVLENTGSKNTDLISELWDCDIELPFPHEEKRKPSAYCPTIDGVTYVCSPKGANVGADDFHAYVDEVSFNMPDYIFPGKTLKFRNVSGRSSDGCAPFWNVHHKGSGFIAALGWTGQWNCHITRESEGVRLRTKIEDTEFVLYPGEKIRTSSVVIMTYQGSSEDSQNKWRRFLRKYFSPVSDVSSVPFSAGIWGGTESSCVLSKLSALDKNEIPV